MFNEYDIKTLIKQCDNNIDTYGYGRGQLFEILVGLLSEVDVNQYLNRDLDRFQMREIRKGLESGVDASQYSDPFLSVKDMREFRYRLEIERRNKEWEGTDGGEVEGDEHDDQQIRQVDTDGESDSDSRVNPD